MARSWSPPAAAALFAGIVGLAPLAARQDPPPPVKRAAAATTAVQSAAKPADAQLTDEEALKQAGLSPTDGAKLIGYLKVRTLTDADQGKIEAVIRRLGADEFEDRERAAEEIERIGPAAVAPLKAAERDPDPEVAYRASRVLKRMEKVPHSAVASAAVRAVVKLNPLPADAAPVLLGYLPMADTDAVAEDIRTALVALAVRDGKPEPALVAALADPSPLRRSAAYVALVEGGPPGERVRVKEAYPKVVAAVRKEPDPEAKFRGLWSLLLTTREKEFVPDLIGMIPDLPRGRLWQFEELLLQLAGTAPTGGWFGKSPESLATARDTWAAWWTRKGSGIDLAKVEFKPRVRGFTDLVEIDNRGFGQGRVVSLGPDLKEKWRILGVSNPTDARVLPNGRVLVVEPNSSRVTERDTTGKILSTRTVSQPLSADPLPNGGMLVVCRGQVVEYNEKGESVLTYTRSNFDIMAGRRLPGGDTLFVTNTVQGANAFRIDPKKKEPSQTYTFGRVQTIHLMDVLGDDRVLVCEADRVVEYDLKTGKSGWEFRTTQPTSAQRLPNGNTLIASLNQNRAVEVTPAGELAWEYVGKVDGSVSRAYRR